MTNLDDLIAETRRALMEDDQERNRYGESNAYPRSGIAELASRLADALEAATCERDAALAAIERVRAEADAYAEQPDVVEPCGAVAQALRATLDGVPNADEWRADARAALEAAARAAQGAAPQAAKDIHEPSHDRVYCVRCGGNWPCQPAPVLPSGGVDEDATAEVFEQ